MIATRFRVVPFRIRWARVTLRDEAGAIVREWVTSGEVHDRCMRGTWDALGDSVTDAERQRVNGITMCGQALEDGQALLESSGSAVLCFGVENHRAKIARVPAGDFAVDGDVLMLSERDAAQLEALA